MFSYVPGSRLPWSGRECSGALPRLFKQRQTNKGANDERLNVRGKTAHKRTVPSIARSLPTPMSRPSGPLPSPTPPHPPVTIGEFQSSPIMTRGHPPLTFLAQLQKLQRREGGRESKVAGTRERGEPPGPVWRRRAAVTQQSIEKVSRKLPSETGIACQEGFGEAYPKPPTHNTSHNSIACQDALEANSGQSQLSTVLSAKAHTQDTQGPEGERQDKTAFLMKVDARFPCCLYLASVLRTALPHRVLQSYTGRGTGTEAGRKFPRQTSREVRPRGDLGGQRCAVPAETLSSSPDERDSAVIALLHCAS
ncbi:hypothetical protein Bbelb_024360 [Branchiostoma belcheri]|nr:hypothetical protein Bbelb_024360 [Branchiostoma belcheri]